MNMFPKNKLLLDWKKSYESCFTICKELLEILNDKNAGINVECEASTSKTINEGEYDQKRENMEVEEETENEGNREKMVDEGFKEGDKEKKNEDKVENEDESPPIPSFALGIVDVDTPKRPRRSVQKKQLLEIRDWRSEDIGDELQSPYHLKTVDTYKNITAVETLISNWLFALDGDQL